MSAARKKKKLKVLAFVTDLFFQATVADSVRDANADLNLVTSLYKFIPELSKTPGVVLIDLEADGISGAALISQIKGTDSSIPVMALAGEGRDDLLDLAEKSGADKVCLKSDFQDDLVGLLEKRQSED